MELSRLERENERLLNRILEKPIIEEKPATENIIKPILPNRMPWRVQRQHLEAEDRERAKLINQQNQQAKVESIAELEQELGVAENARQEEAASQS